ncbi:MAG: SDR family oxidoreductase [Coriobacteriia bacterium]
MTASSAERTILVMGASGYIGSHLLEALSSSPHRLRAAARRPEKVQSLSGMAMVKADALDEQAVGEALADVDIAFYLVHTLGAGAGYAERDRRAATIFAKAAAEKGVHRIVYLGGLGDDKAVLSDHLASRQEVGTILASTGVPVIEFRASIVIGTYSTSFEMIRNLVEKLPVMTTPSWVRMPAQPIAISDVLAYLIAAIDTPHHPTGHAVYEIGGSDVVSYGDIMRLYAQRRGLKRLVIPIPLLSPGVSGWWLHLFTPKEATVGRQLAQSLRFPTVVTSPAARTAFPEISPIGTVEAIDRALADEAEEFERINWTEELRGAEEPTSLLRAGRYVDSRVIRVSCPPEAAFDPVACIGGERGWYAYDTLWDIRGFLDILVGGPGHRRGRRNQYVLVEGDYLEWWRVERILPPSLLRLKAEMRMPGDGWLQYEISPTEDGSLVRQTAIFHAKGLLGLMYWYVVLPFHHFVFNGTLQGIDRECRALVAGPNTCPLPGAYDVALRERRGADAGSEKN